MALLLKVFSSILAAVASIWIGYAVEHAEMQRDFQKLAPPPPPVTAMTPEPVRRSGRPSGMAHALQHHEGR